MKHKRTTLVVGVGLCLILLVTLAQWVMTPIHKLNDWEKPIEASRAKNGPWPVNTAPLDSLQRELALRKALLELPKKDSIHLLINLADSSINLFMNGLTIYQAKATAIEVDPLIKRLNTSVYWTQWSIPRKTVFFQANIVKEPVIEKVAPKTQEEFLASVTSPDSLIYDPAFVHLALDNGTQLILSDEANKFGGRTGRKLYSAYRWKRRGVFLKSVITFSQYTYEPKVYLEAENKALTAIYRALPEQPKVVIYYR